MVIAMVAVPMPKLSMNMSEGHVIEWLVDDCQAVEAGQDIVEIESEKATAVVNAPTAGEINIVVPAGESVSVGTVLAEIGPADGSAEGHTFPMASDAGSTEPTGDGLAVNAHGSMENRKDDRDDRRRDVRGTPAARRLARERGVSIETVADELGIARVSPDDVRQYSVQTDDEIANKSDGGNEGVRASPAARQAARDHGMELESLKGSGPDAAIVLADVHKAVEQDAPEPVTMQPAEAGAATSDQVPVRDRREITGVRAVIARRLSESWRTAPHVTVERDIDVGRVREVKALLERELAVPVSLTDLFLVAVAETLDRHPNFNATVEDNEHVRYDRIDVGIAVDTDRGLISPVLRDVGGKPFTRIVSERAELVEQTQDGSVDANRLEGGTFTVSNLGTLGVDSFTPIINPPQVGILGLSTVRREPRETADGDVEFHDVMTTSLSFDHRAVDGADAARFLETFDDILSRPLSAVIS